MHVKETLPNGLRVVTTELPQTLSATISIYVGAGSRYEPDSEAGLSHFLEHMLFKGASRRPTAKLISEAIETVGGIHNAGTDRELTVYYAKVPHGAALEVIDILADMVTAPAMDPGELEKERSVILEELASIEDSPDELVGILIDETLWPGQPIGRNIGGTPETVKSVPLPAVVRYLRDQYVPSNMVLSVAGNIRHQEVVEAAHKWIGDMPARDPIPCQPALPRGSANQLAVRHKETEQAHVCLAYPTVSLESPDRWAIDLLSTILGEGMSSRLFLELREERALVYDIHSYPAEFTDAGALAIYAGCDPAKTRSVLEAAIEQVEKLLKALPDAELAKAKEMARGRVQLRMEDTRAVAGWTGAQELLQGHILTVEDVVERISHVSVDDVLAAGRKYLRPENAVLAAVGPFEDLNVFYGLLG